MLRTLDDNGLKHVFVKVNPNIQFEETEISFLKNQSFVKIKTGKEKISLSVWDSPELEKFIETNPENKIQAYVLTLYDGCGVPLEEWTLHDGQIIDLVPDAAYDDSEKCYNFTIEYEKIEYKNLPSLNTYQGGFCLGNLGQKVKCPKCEHEFQTGLTILF